MTFTSQRISQIWYPSNGIHGKKGIVLGAYQFFDPTGFFDRMTPDERIEYAAKCGEKIHPGYSDYIESGVSVILETHESHDGLWHAMDRGIARALLQTACSRPAGGRHYMIGDQISYHASWQEGAMASAEYALLDLDQRVRAASSISRKG